MRKLNNRQYQKAADTLRMLAVDAVEQAGSGHPGLPMGAADFAFTLWHDFLHFNPKDPKWPGRDRFILSAGHGSALLYGLLHLFGYEVSLEEIKNFRQWKSKTPGHPETGHTPGVEATTGPLGQGFANGVGMALAQKMVSARLGLDRQKILEHYIYALVSDGDLMEGISSEAASLAGHLKLGNIIYLYDDNRITIDGQTGLSFSEDVGARFKALGWHVQRIDGHDHLAVHQAVKKAMKILDRPSLILARTRLAQGSPNKCDFSAAHGAPLGREEVTATRKNLGWPQQTFYIPDEVKLVCQKKVARDKREYNKWQKNFAAWRLRNPEKAGLWDKLDKKEIPAGLYGILASSIKPEPSATRSLSGQLIQKIAEICPSLAGGSADLAGSTNAEIKGSAYVSAENFDGRNIHFGIREHAMGAIMNGLSLYGFFLPFGSTFLVFSDYCRPAVRLSALMKQQAVYIFTHDSFYLGEDGPTHQPIEHVSSLRLIPGLQVIRPADALETAAAWTMALGKKDGPTALILTRQKLSVIERSEKFDCEDVLRGGYMVSSQGQGRKITLMASGSETGLAVEAAKLLASQGLEISVVSVPCLELFLEQSEEYRKTVIPGDSVKVALEAGRGALWRQLIGGDGLFIGIEHFGASAPDKVLAKEFGFTAEQVAEKIKKFLG
ncbi:transketolase [candidate division TA06 bacterium]|uniref:Transketolase n=1 Tax=candidate division TA06 bacterium TaxID=2250710 RepID=A0A933MIX8_UNCT6|nr:transketolase [candidate division TA06 bacterium]